MSGPRNDAADDAGAAAPVARVAPVAPVAWVAWVAPPSAWRLASVTPAAWAETVARDVPALLSDHAHLELKAAASALALLKRQARRPLLAQRLAALAREEAEHLQRVLRELERRGLSLAPDRPSAYARGLLAAAGAPRRRERGLLDSLLVSALIEMRSHERFERMAECAALADLAPLYGALAEAEARHGELLLDLAREACPEPEAAARFAELAAAEAALLAGLPCEPRIHSGPPA